MTDQELRATRRMIIATQWFLRLAWVTLAAICITPLIIDIANR